MPSRKPLIQGYGCRLGGDTLSCEALFVAKDVPAQSLVGELIVRHKPPARVLLAWSPVTAGVLHKDARIDVVREGS